jgi:uncharacterized protein
VIRIVLDTVILVRALINSESSWGEIVFRRADDFVLVVSPIVVAEYLEVLNRPVLTRKYRMVSGDEFITVLKLLDEAEIVEVEGLPRVCRDPNDDKFVATAIAGEASIIVTEDRDLLVLGEYQSISLMTAETFLERLVGESGLGVT